MNLLFIAEVLELELELELEGELELELVHVAPGVDGEKQSAALNNIRREKKER